MKDGLRVGFVRLGMKVFWCWLGAFYLTWLSLVLLNDGWNLISSHWPISVAMAGGSYFAGSTPMGGGTVGFPILVLLFGGPANLGRDFSFAIQSIGMVSASIFILCRRQPLAWPMLRGAFLGSMLGTPLGLFILAPHLSGLMVKLVFAMGWASFGVLHLVKIRDIVGNQGMLALPLVFQVRSGFLVGFIGSFGVSSITGVGVDMLIYAILVLIFRADLKVAIPTSVLLMAQTSLVGILTLWIRGAIHPDVWPNWLAAVPVVAVGAPFGALIVAKIGRAITLILVSILCVFQFFWTLWLEWDHLSAWGRVGAFAGVAALNLLFALFFRIGVNFSKSWVEKGTEQ